MTSYHVDIQIADEFRTLVAATSLRLAVITTLQQQAIPAAQLTVVITDDSEIQTLNAQFRGVDAPTDVLSFPNWEDASDPQDELIVPQELAAHARSYLGDIVIAYPYTARQAAHYQAEIDAELRLLAIHGTLHLLGYDHATPEEETIMWTLQNQVLRALGEPAMPQRTFDP